MTQEKGVAPKKAGQARTASAAKAPQPKRAPRVNVADELLASLHEAAHVMVGKVASSRFYPAWAAG